MRYKIVLYNAGKRVKVIDSFRKYSEAKHFYQLNLSTKFYFPKLSTWDGKKTDYELVLLGPPEGKNITHKRDEHGRVVHLKTKNDHTLKLINPFFVEEKFTYKNEGRKIQFPDLVKQFLFNEKGPKIITVLNNKVVFEHSDCDDIEVFTLKNASDARRLSQAIKRFCVVNEIFDHLFFEANRKLLRIRLYLLIEERLGIDRLYMMREATR